MNEDNRRKLWTLIQEAGLYLEDLLTFNNEKV